RPLAELAHQREDIQRLRLEWRDVEVDQGRHDLLPKGVLVELVRLVRSQQAAVYHSGSSSSRVEQPCSLTSLPMRSATEFADLEQGSTITMTRRGDRQARPRAWRPCS